MFENEEEKLKKIHLDMENKKSPMDNLESLIPGFETTTTIPAEQEQETIQINFQATETRTTFSQVPYSSLRMLKRLEGHADMVRSLAELQNGDLVSASSDQTLKIWDLKKDTLKTTLNGHKGVVSCVTVLKNGDIASGSWDNTIKIWNATSGELKTSLTDHTNWLNTLIVLKNGDLVSGADDNSIKIWDMSEKSAKYGKVKATLYGHTDWAMTLLELPNGDLVSGSADKTIKV